MPFPKGGHYRGVPLWSFAALVGMDRYLFTIYCVYTVTGCLLTEKSHKEQFEKLIIKARGSEVGRRRGRGRGRGKGRGEGNTGQRSAEQPETSDSNMEDDR